MRKRFLTTSLVALSSVAFVQANPERPNIILVMADDLGWGDVSYTNVPLIAAEGGGNEWCQTPNLDAMAASGIRFDRFYAAAAVCSPTRASCLTGRNPLRVGVPWANRGHLGHDDGGPDSETPLSSVLADAGYRTGHFGKWHLGVLTTETNDGNRGGSGSSDLYSAPWHFSYDTCFANESSIPTYHPYRRTNNSAALPTSFTDSNFYGTRFWKIPLVWNYDSGEGIAAPVEEVNNAVNGDSSKLIVDKAVDFMQDAVDSNEPFFAVIWFATPHTPVIHVDEDDPATPGTAKQRALKLNIEDMDTAMGDLNTALENMGVKGDTMLWFTSDNGPENTANGSVEWFDETSGGRSMRSGRLRARKRSLYEGGIRVPGILQWPSKITSGFSTDHVAVTSDYYSTILDYLDLSVPGQKPLDGISLRPVIEGTATSRTQPVGFYARGMRSWMKQQYKIVATGAGSSDTAVVPTTNSTQWELYDIDAPSVNSDIEDTGHSSYLGKASLDDANDAGNALPQATKDIFIEMIGEYQAWEATLQEDTVYAHSSQPTVVLSGPGAAATGAFTVNVAFSEAVTELSLTDFIIENGVASSLTGSGSSWSITVTPGVAGSVFVDLPAGSVNDADGSTNISSNQLEVDYADPAAANVTLSTSASTVSAPFTVDVVFSENVTGLETSDFSVINGEATTLVGSGLSYTVTITPTSQGEVSVKLPVNSAVNVGVVGNNPSNTVTVTYTIPVGTEGTSEGVTVNVSAAGLATQTVDADEVSPAAQDNNVEKFTAGTVNDGIVNPFTTTLYTRSGTGTDRDVRAFYKFDLSEVEAPVNSATMTFTGHSLNNQTSMELEVVALSADWDPSGTPALTFEHGTVGDAISLGSIHTDLDPADHTKEYSVDISNFVRNWIDGTWPNYGLQFRLTSTSASNGVGIKTSGEGALALAINSVPLEVMDATVDMDDFTIEWNSISNGRYRIESNTDLGSEWQLVAEVLGSAGGTTVYDLPRGEADDKRFYRIVFVQE